MSSRMDRYEEIKDKAGVKYSRSNKNKDLYENIGNNTKFTNFTDVSKVNAVSLDDARKNSKTREGYKTIKEYGNYKPELQKELDDFNYLYDREEKVYDINSVIKSAKENRKEKDALEEKRRLKNTNYNILASLDKKSLEEYRKEKQERNKPESNEELRELIDTIASKTLAGEITKEMGVDLLSDLMATSVNDKVEAQATSEESIVEEFKKEQKIEDKEIQEEKDESIEEEKKEEVKEKEEKIDDKVLEEIKKEKDELEETTNDLLKDVDRSFYTKSMDLSDKDFVFDELDERKVPVIVKILLVIILLALIAVGTYFIVKKI